MQLSRKFHLRTPIFSPLACIFVYLSREINSSSPTLLQGINTHYSDNCWNRNTSINNTATFVTYGAIHTYRCVILTTFVWPSKKRVHTYPKRKLQTHPPPPRRSLQVGWQLDSPQQQLWTNGTGWTATATSLSTQLVEVVVRMSHDTRWPPVSRVGRIGGETLRLRPMLRWEWEYILSAILSRLIDAVRDLR